MSTLELVPGTAAHRDAIPDLIWATGPASYRYIFGDRATFDRFVGASWGTADTYFGHTEATVAVAGDTVVGVEIGSHGARNYETKANLAGVSMALVERGALSPSDLDAILERAERASYLNPFVPPSAYYVLALAVMPGLRGTGLARDSCRTPSSAAVAPGAGSSTWTSCPTIPPSASTAPAGSRPWPRP